MQYSQILIIVALISGTGCILQETHLEPMITILPSSIYLDSGYSCGRDAMVNRGTGHLLTEAEIIQWLLFQGLSKDEAQAEYNDPFFSKRMEYLSFKCDKFGKEVAEYYERQFLQKGWRKKRDILNLEYTNGGGDWVGVYIYDSYTVLVHVIGRWKEDDRHLFNDSISYRQVIFRFDGCTADIIFGKNAINTFRNAALYGKASE